MPKFNIDGVGLNYEIHSGVLPFDTIFLHGNLASNRWWKPALQVWKSTAKPGLEGRAILVEWRGNGDSDAPQSSADLNPEVLAQDHIRLLKHLGVAKACLVGHSTGGLIGLIAMMRAPELFHRAFLLDPVAASGVQFDQPMYDAFTQMSQSRDFCAMILGATIHGNDAKSPFFQELVDDAFRIAKTNWHGVPDALKSTDVSGELEKLAVPTLVAHGEFDTLLPKEKSVEMANRLQNGQFLEITGQGHSCNVENPRQFVSLVDQFLFEKTNG